MRIISGKLRGLRLAPVGTGDASAHLRPTSDRVRESIFNLLMGGAYGNPVTGMRVLDLFAGTGALGLEAWSRGAAHVTFVDNNRNALSLNHRNIDLCRAGATTQALCSNATGLGGCKTAAFDLIFLDPPYGKCLGPKALTATLAGGWLNRDALIVFEEGQALPPPAGFELLDQRRYGDTHISILRPEVAN